MTDSTNSSPAEQAADRALREGLRAKGLSLEALKRIRSVTEAEWRSTLGEVSPALRPRRWMPFAMAASAALLAVAATLSLYLQDNRSASGAVLGSVSRSDAPGLRAHHWLRSDETLGAGADLRVFQELEARGDSLVSLAGGGNLRVSRGSSFEVVTQHSIRLTRGELYVDIPPGARGSDPFSISTADGEFRHRGTQFAVAVTQQQTRLRVREGVVLWKAANGESIVNAGTELTIDQGKAGRRDIPTAGRDWAWAESLAPEVDIENRPLREFLEWFSRETGRKLVLADDEARRQAASIRMHGNIRGLTAMEALSAVMASTTLRYELPEGVIRVSSARDPRPPS
jgi:ferric-dicitrate binding protein FerR (iron transport regulator)